MERGYGAVQSARNWDKLAQKLSKPGSNIQVAVFGTSLTQGLRKDKGFAETWAHEVQHWLQAAFPSTSVDLINLARDATDVVPAAVCWYQRVPADTDLIIIDYSLAGCTLMSCVGVGAEQVAQYESLMRRLTRNAPNAALLLLEHFYFLDMALPGQPPAPIPYYQTGGDMHWMLARRYRAPMVSVRDALYDVIFNDTALKAALGVTRDEMMVDVLHPNAKGHRIIGGGIVAYALRRTLQDELGRIVASDKSSSASAPAATAMQQLPDAVTPLAAHEADGDTFCVEGHDLNGVVAAASVESGGWQWINSVGGTAADKDACRTARAARGYKVNCGNWGLSTRGVGKRLEFVIDTQNIPSSSNGASRGSSSSSQLDQRRLVVFYDRAMFKGFRVGNSSEPPTALLQCVRGCSCSAVLLGADSLTWSELMASGSTEVSRHPQCVVRLTILDRGANTNDYFKVNGIAVVPFKQPKMEHRFAEIALARERLFLNAYKSRLMPQMQLDAPVA